MSFDPIRNCRCWLNRDVKTIAEKSYYSDCSVCKHSKQGKIHDPNTSNTAWHRLSANAMCMLVRRTLSREIYCHHSHANGDTIYRERKCCHHHRVYLIRNLPNRQASSGIPSLKQHEHWTDTSFVLKRMQVPYASLVSDTVLNLFDKAHSSLRLIKSGAIEKWPRCFMTF